MNRYLPWRRLGSHADRHPNGPPDGRQYLGSAVPVGIAVLGLAASAVAASHALGMGEAPITLLPGGGWIASRRVPAVVAARAATVALAYGFAARVVPRFRLHALAAAGVGWLLWAVWQLWVLLALT